MGRHYTDDEVLEFLLDGVDENCTDLTPSDELEKLWDKWHDRVYDVLEQFWNNNQSDVTVDLDDVYMRTKSVNVDFDVYATCVGMGVGMQDGDWDHFFIDRGARDRCVKFVENTLRSVANKVEMAIQDEAMSQCEEREAEDTEDEDADEYSVLVGNIGSVWHGDDSVEAHAVFDDYVRQSLSNNGRAGGEQVTLFKNDDVLEEHFPPARRGAKIRPVLDGLSAVSDNHHLFRLVSTYGLHVATGNTPGSYSAQLKKGPLVAWKMSKPYAADSICDAAQKALVIFKLPGEDHMAVLEQCRQRAQERSSAAPRRGAKIKAVLDGFPLRGRTR